MIDILYANFLKNWLRGCNFVKMADILRSDEIHIKHVRYTTMFEWTRQHTGTKLFKSSIGNYYDNLGRLNN